MSLQIESNIPLSKFTTLHVGGPAKSFVRVQTMADVQVALRYAEEKCMPYFILGGGSNILVRDEGFPGLIIKMEPRTIRIEGHEVSADAGTLTRLVAMTIVRHGLSGMEHMAGIPGTVGGAIRGNAGSFGTETKDVLARATVLHRTRHDWEIETLPREVITFGYRDSMFKQDASYVVFSGVFHVVDGDVAEGNKAIDADLAARRAKQPYEFPSVGSIFKNPPGDSSGKRIEEAGLKGLRIGDAQVSEKHANFIVNRGKANATDILTLIAEIKKRVLDHSGVILEEEIVIMPSE